ncbi:MAG: oligosaccharide repeat unit polymerase [Clostridia bacterium]|nr:oligosaccharide repeat unit polymerase [Clostridia bacterium]
MNVFLSSIIIIVATVFSIYCYYKASGTLNPGKINLISMTGALFFLQTFIGSALIMLGFNRHYTLDRLIDRQGSVSTTFIVVMLVSVAFPLLIYLFLRIFKVNPQKDYAAYLEKKTEYYDSKLLFWLVLIAGIICLSLLAMLLKKIGYLPIIKMFFHNSDFDLSLERIRNTETTVFNQYVTNIMIHLAVPVIAYFTFACALASKKIKWWVLATIFFIASVITKTYNFAKAPIVFFLVVYLFVFIYYIGGIKKRWVFLMSVSALIMFILTYSAFGADINITDIYNGIWGRTFFTQVGTLSFNFDLFPHHINYLQGRSFASILLPLFGFNSSEHLRSARLIMEIYGSEGVYNGSAGVMNSLFIGEAYANFGWLGIIFSVLWIALIISAFFFLIMRFKKTPATITLFAYFTVNMATATQGGFCDFVYNITWTVVFLALLVCHFLFVQKDHNKKSPAFLRKAINGIKIVFKKGLVHILTGNFMTKLVSLFGSIFLVRILSKQEYGILGYLENIYGYVFVLAGMGMANAILRYVVLGETSSKKYGYFNYCFKKSLIWNVALCVLAAVIFFFYPHKQDYKDYAWLLNILFLMLPLQNICEICLCNERAMFSNQRYATFSLILSAAVILGKIISGAIAGIRTVVFGQLITYAILAIIFYLASTKKYYNGIKPMPIERNEQKTVNKYSLQYMITNGLWTIFMLNDVFLLGRFCEPSVLADYRVAYTIPGCVTIISSAIGVFLAPYFVRNENNTPWVRRYFKLTYIASAAVIGFVCLIIALLSKHVIWLLYGEQYLNITPIMQLLLLAAFFNCGLRYTTANLLAAMGRIKYNMIVSAAGMGLQILINIFVVTRYGAIGVAITSCVVYFLMAITLLIIFIKSYYLKDKKA